MAFNSRDIFADFAEATSPARVRQVEMMPGGAFTARHHQDPKNAEYCSDNYARNRDSRRAWQREYYTRNREVIRQYFAERYANKKAEKQKQQEAACRQL